MEAKLTKEHILETKVRLAIQANKLLRLDNPIVAQQLSKQKQWDQECPMPEAN